MASEGSEGRQEQEEYLRRALEKLPERLVDDYGGREAAIQSAFTEADGLFEEVAEKWAVLRKVEARVEAMEASPQRRILIWLSRSPEANRSILVAILLGVGLVAYALLWPRRATATVGLELALVGSAWLFIPRLLTMFEAYFAPSRAASNVLKRMARRFRLNQWAGWSALLVGGALYLAWFLEPRPAVVEVVGAAAILIGLSLLSARFLGRPLLEELQIAKESLFASRLAYTRELRSRALGRLRSRLGTRTDLGTDLRYTDFSGLAEMDDAAREVPTATKDRLIGMMKLMPGGTIALAGSRGAGKSTLMRSVCESGPTRPKQQAPLHVIVDAPVKYEARDFVLHLFARLCTAVVGEDQVRRLRSDRPLGQRANPSRLLGDPQLMIGMFCITAGLLVTFGSVAGVGVSSPLGWGIILALGGYLLAGSRYLSVRRTSSEAEAMDSLSRDPNVHTAIQRLRQIWFQQSFSQGWSGGFKVPVGIEGGLSGSTELSEQQLSLPDIVDLFREFLGQVAEGREVRIGIDELDKMDDESARRFLNELKVVFRVSDCFFFLSISEEAMSHFERRGLHIRDVFDSSLDAVVQVPHLQFKVSQELLERRIVELPQPFSALLHCLSGGLPRDLIRAARDLVGLEQEMPLTEAAARLLRDNLRAKVDAARVVCRIVELEEGPTALAAWVDRVSEANFDPADLLEVCREFDETLLGLDSAGQTTEPAAHRAELRALGAQLAAFVYYAATLLEFFGKFTAREYATQAIFGGRNHGQEPLVDQLAAASQALSAGVGTGWEMLSAFRVESGLEGSLPFPSRPSTTAGESLAEGSQSRPDLVSG
ncbi:MAG TPA: hypothetical protein VKB23_07330 [Solirubrobacterales bacterium]|nr:hypothetical protein [Solirubrobacterales bacterium]